MVQPGPSLQVSLAQRPQGKQEFGGTVAKHTPRNMLHVIAVKLAVPRSLGLDNQGEDSLAGPWPLGGGSMQGSMYQPQGSTPYGRAPRPSLYAQGVQRGLHLGNGGVAEAFWLTQVAGLPMGCLSRVKPDRAGARIAPQSADPVPKPESCVEHPDGNRL